LEKTNISLVGDLYVKNIVGLRLDFPKEKENLEYRWYKASSPTGEWNQLQGVWTKKIVLLTSYVGNYVKCEITYNEHSSEKKVTASVV
tara:strand:+ start:14870 stop:15133 length:264 start_codon:yes stop_codon:yes gene_type:complete